MSPEALRFLQRIKNGKSQIIFKEAFHQKLVVSLVDYLINLNQDFDEWDIMCLAPLLERDTLKKYTKMDLNDPIPLEKLHATYDAINAALTRYIDSINTGYLDKIPYYSYFYSSKKTNFKQALINFRDKELLTIYSKLYQEAGQINTQSVRNVNGKG